MGQKGRTQLHQVARGAHDQEANADGLADLGELLLVGYTHCRENSGQYRISAGLGPVRREEKDEDSRFVHRLMNWPPSLMNSLGTSRIWSAMAAAICGLCSVGDYYVWFQKTGRE